jgi:hypothetical protein
MGKNLVRLFKSLVAYKFNFTVSAITTQMFFRDEEHAEWDSKAQQFKVYSYPLANRIEIYDDLSRKVTVYDCKGLDALVDMDNKEFTVMDYEEVVRWALRELRDEDE